MNVWPLIECELRVALRRPSTRRLRMACAAGAMAIAIWNIFVWSAWRPVAALGQSFFHILAAVGFVGALCSGLLLAADSVSQEKREGTLGLLFLTDLHAGDIVLGKFIAKSILPLYGLMALVPTLAVTVLLGGITVGEFARMFLAWANALTLAMAASVWTSTYCWQQRPAHVSAGFVLLLLSVAVPWLGTTLSRTTGTPAWGAAVLLISPTGPYQFAFEKAYQVSAGWFWASLIVNQIFSWTVIALAMIRVLRTRWEGADGAGEAGSKKWLTSRTIDPARRECSRALLARRPMDWLERHKAGHQLVFWIGSAIGAVLFFFLPLAALGGSRAQIGYVLLIAITTAVKLWAAAQAAYAFTADRRSGALESLLGTRVEVPEIMAGAFRGAVRRFTGPLTIAGALCVSLAGYLVLRGAIGQGLILLLGAALLVTESYCLFWIGLFQGLAARSPAVAFAAATARILVLPWLWLAILTQFFRGSPFEQLVVVFLVIILVNHTIFTMNARASFVRYFRTLALKPFGEKAPHLESDWSPISWEEEASTSEPVSSTAGAEVGVSPTR